MASSCSQAVGLSKPRYELADIFGRYLEDYLRTRKLSPFQRKVVEAILKCRTAACGGHILRCSYSVVATA